MMSDCVAKISSVVCRLIKIDVTILVIFFFFYRLDSIDIYVHLYVRVLHLPFGNHALLVKLIK